MVRVIRAVMWGSGDAYTCCEKREGDLVEAGILTELGTNAMRTAPGEEVFYSDKEVGGWNTHDGITGRRWNLDEMWAENFQPA